MVWNSTNPPRSKEGMFLTFMLGACLSRPRVNVPKREVFRLIVSFSSLSSPPAQLQPEPENSYIRTLSFSVKNLSGILRARVLSLLVADLGPKT